MMAKMLYRTNLTRNLFHRGFAFWGWEEIKGVRVGRGKGLDKVEWWVYRDGVGWWCRGRMSGEQGGGMVGGCGWSKR